MMLKRRWGFGLGTFFSLIVIYFIYLYSKDKGWALLAFISKWYLILVGSLIAVSLGIILFVIIISLLVFLFAMLKLHGFRKKHKKRPKEYIDVEYKVKND
jgi:predicted membrane protein